MAQESQNIPPMFRIDVTAEGSAGEADNSNNASVMIIALLRQLVGSLASEIVGARVGAKVRKQPHHLYMALTCCKVQRRVAACIPCIKRGPTVQRCVKARRCRTPLCAPQK